MHLFDRPEAVTVCQGFHYKFKKKSTLVLSVWQPRLNVGIQQGKYWCISSRLWNLLLKLLVNMTAVRLF